MQSVEFSIESKRNNCYSSNIDIAWRAKYYSVQTLLTPCMVISCLLVPWILWSPGHQQTCYWLCRKSVSRISWGWISTTCTASLPQIVKISRQSVNIFSTQEMTGLLYWLCCCGTKLVVGHLRVGLKQRYQTRPLSWMLSQCHGLMRP